MKLSIDVISFEVNGLTIEADLKALREESKSKPPEPSGGTSKFEAINPLDAFLNKKGLTKLKTEEQKI